MKTFPCPLSKAWCTKAGNKIYSYGFTSGTASYCWIAKRFVCDLKVCPKEGEKK